MHLLLNSATQFQVVQICACSAAFERDVHPRVFHWVNGMQIHAILSSTVYTPAHNAQCKANAATCKIPDQSKRATQPTRAMLRLTSSFQPLCDCKTCIQKSGMPDTSLSGSAGTAACDQGRGQPHAPAIQQSGLIRCLLCQCAGVPCNRRHRRQPMKRIRSYTDLKAQVQNIQVNKLCVCRYTSSTNKNLGQAAQCH